jgi:hypothetical protein
MVEIITCSNCGRLRVNGNACLSCGDPGNGSAAPLPKQVSSALPEDPVLPMPAERPRRRGRARGTAFHIMGLLLIVIVVVGIAAVGLPIWTSGDSSGSLSVSPAELAAKVQANMGQLLPTNPDYQDLQLTGDLLLVNTGEGAYRGTIDASKAGKPIVLTIAVTYDGEGFMWRIVSPLPSTTSSTVVTPSLPDTTAE